MESSRTADTNIRVYARFRPLNPREIAQCVRPVHRKQSPTTVSIRTQKEREQLNFTFDGVFDVDSSQQQVYELAGRSIVSSLFDGLNGTIFAYGQTASGKTYTMQGPPLNECLEKNGIIPRAVDQIFATIEESPCIRTFTLKVSVVEIYLEKIRDLLEPGNLNLKIRSQPKRGTFIEGVTEVFVTSRQELMGYYNDAVENRATMSTRENDRSSRSHFVMIVTVAQEDTFELSIRTGKLFLVDLAGSEKTNKSGVEGQALRQANKINSSLTSLGKVIKALSDSRQQHVPYRQSKLTRILQESLGGNSKTTLIVTCSPFMGNLSETLSTMRFGVSTRKIRNRPIINRQLTLNEMQLLLDRTRNESLQKSRKIDMLENFIRRELGDVPEIGLQASTCASCYVGRGSSSPQFIDVECQSPTKSEAYEMSDLDSCTRFGESETSGYLTGRSEDASFVQSQYETFSNSNNRQSEMLNQTEAPSRKQFKLLSLKISCSNVDQPHEHDEQLDKPLTERTPRWVHMDNPQEYELMGKTQEEDQDNIMPVVNGFCDREGKRRTEEQPWFKNVPSGVTSVDTSFCAADTDQPFQMHLGLVENPQGYENLPTSRPDYAIDQQQLQSSRDLLPSHRNNTIEEQSIDDDLSHLSWKERSDLFRKRVAEKQVQSRLMTESLQQIRRQRQRMRERFQQVVDGSAIDTPRGS